MLRPPVQVEGKMHVHWWIQQVTTRVGAVTCWIQQSVSPKQVVGFTCVFNSEIDQLIRKSSVCCEDIATRLGGVVTDKPSLGASRSVGKRFRQTARRAQPKRPRPPGVPQYKQVEGQVLKGQGLGPPVHRQIRKVFDTTVTIDIKTTRVNKY